MLYLRDSGARLRILRGDLAGGVAELLDAGRRFDSVDGRNPALIAWRSSAALALLQLGERSQARRLVAEELEFARGWGAPGRSAQRSGQQGLSRAASEGSRSSARRSRC